MNTTVFGVMIAALMVAVAVLLFSLGRMVYGIAHYYVVERKPAKTLHDPELGALTLESGAWIGRIRCGNTKALFLVGGSEACPEPRLLDRLRSVIPRLPQLNQRGQDFLRAQESELSARTLEFSALEVCDESRKDAFTLEYIAEADGDRVWRVDFEAGEPKHTSFDD